MPDIAPNNTSGFDFSLFNDNTIFKGLEFEKMLTRMVGIYGKLTEAEKLAIELKEKENDLLKAGINSITDSAKIRRQIFDISVQEKGLFNGMLEAAKNNLKLTKTTAEIKGRMKNQTIDLVQLEKELKEYRDLEGPKNSEFEKHLEKTIRDKQHVLALEKIGYESMVKGAVMGKFLTSDFGQGVIGVIGLVGKVLSKIGGGLISLIKGVFNTLTSVFSDSWNLWLRAQTLTGNIAADMGQTEIQTQQVNNNINKMGIAAGQWGVNIEDALSFMVQFSQITGLNHMLLADQVSDLSAIAKSTGLGVQATGEMYAQMELLGYSTSNFRSYVENSRKTASELGLNITKVLTTVKQLLPAYNALNFKGGVDGLTNLVMKAQGLRFELDNMRNLSNNLFNPEGAIELAAKLKVLGGSFARMADPFSLMLKAQTDAAGLMEDVINSVSGLAIKGKDGLFSIPPAQQALLREFAAATGENVDNLVRSSIESAKQNDIMAQLRSRGIFNKDDLTAVANLAEYDKESKQYRVKIDMAGTTKAIGELSSGLITQLRGVVREEQQVTTTRMNLMEQLKNLYNMFLFSLQPIFRPIEALLKDSGFMMQLQRTMKDLGNFIARKIEPLFNSGGGVYEWMYKLGDKLKNIVQGLTEILQGNGGLMDVLAKVAVTLIGKMWAVIQPSIAELLAPVKEKVVETGQTVGRYGGMGLGAAIAGALIAATGVGFVPGVIMMGTGLLGGSYLGQQTANNLTSGILQDAVIRSDGSVQRFRKDDLVVVGTNLDGKKNGVNMTPSRDIMTQVTKYPKEQYSPLSSPSINNNNVPQSITLNLSGVLEIKGENNSAYLTSADLKNIGLQHLTYMILNETDRYRNHQSGKKLSNEIITPIGSR